MRVSGDQIRFGLSTLPFLMNGKTRSISAENPDGSRGGGATCEPEPGTGPAGDLGKGWKVRPCIKLAPGAQATLAEIEGPGIIQHIWITTSPSAFRSCIIRIYWDGEETPSVEAPLGDFFCNGHGKPCSVVSVPINVNPVGGFNCYWPMPFRRSARVTVENQRWEDIDCFFYQITYALTEVPEEAAYFHAQWRRSMTAREKPEHVILDGVTGRGQYVGTYLAWCQLSDGWWGEGEIKFFLDGDAEYPTICGTGTEDYVGGAWCFGEQTYTAPFVGYPFYEREPGRVPKHGLYRFHVMDPIRFDEDLRVTIQALGWWPDSMFQPLTDDIASTAYWYQAEPHGSFPAMPPYKERYPR
jgi:hypothetical protein